MTALFIWLEKSLKEQRLSARRKSADEKETSQNSNVR